MVDWRNHWNLNYSSDAHRVNSHSLVALLLGLLLTRHITKPLNHLMEAVRKVGKGDLSSRVEVNGNGDIAILARDFNRMTEQLTRNEEVRRNMVADIAHELRTPLAVILGKLESIQEGVLPSTPETILPIQDETLTTDSFGERSPTVEPRGSW